MVYNMNKINKLTETSLVTRTVFAALSNTAKERRPNTVQVQRLYKSIAPQS